MACLVSRLFTHFALVFLEICDSLMFTPKASVDVYEAWLVVSIPFPAVISYGPDSAVHWRVRLMLDASFLDVKLDVSFDREGQIVVRV